MKTVKIVNKDFKKGYMTVNADSPQAKNGKLYEEESEKKRTRKPGVEKVDVSNTESKQNWGE